MFRVNKKFNQIKLSIIFKKIIMASKLTSGAAKRKIKKQRTEPIKQITKTDN